MKIKKRLFSLLVAAAMLATIIPSSLFKSSAAFTGALQFDTNGKFTVMQIADIQSSSAVGLSSRVITFIENTIARYNPDLCVFTGDNQTGGSFAYKAVINKFLAPLNDTNTKFAVTFGNHDEDGFPNVTKQTQYDYYKSSGGSNFVDHDISALSGVGSGVIPIYANGQTSGTPAFQLFPMDSGMYASSGYDCPYTDQIDYYIQRSQTYPDVPSLWYQHIIVPDVYYETMIQVPSGTANSYGGSATPFSSSTWALDPAKIDWSKSSQSLSEIYKEPPCPANWDTYTSTAHRSSATYGSKTLYESWVAYGNMLGTYYGHDHKNSFVTTTDDGIDIGYGKAPTLASYNDGNPGMRIFQLDVDGTYTSESVTEADIAKAMVSFDANDGTGYVANQYITKNSTATLNTNTFTRTGYSFAGWATSAGGAVAYTDRANISIGTANVTLYAKWETNSHYNITFNANGGVGGTGPTSMHPGEALNPPTVTKTGYVFTGWLPTVPASVGDADATYTAQWAANTYTINYLGNGSDSGDTTASAHVYDVTKKLTVNGFNKIGNTFLGWSTDFQATTTEYINEQSVVNLTTQPNDVISFYAVWSVNSYTISFDGNNGEGGTSDLMPYGATLTAPTVTRANYTFVGWSPEVPSTVPAQNTTYTAQWTLKQYTIVFEANGGTGGTSKLMPYGTTLTAPMVDREGYTFLGWLPEVPNKVPAIDTIYTALWSVNNYTIVFDDNGGTGGTSGIKQYGAALIPPEVTKTGYNFIGWLPVPGNIVPAADSVYVAQWSIGKYSITFDAAGGTGGTTELLTFDSPLTPPVVVKPGFTFTGWTPTVPVRVPGANTVYSAQWTVETFTIAFDANGGTGGTSGTYEFGEPLSAPTVTKTGYTFIGWSPAVPSAVPAVDTTYIAQWFLGSYRITFEAAGGSGGTSEILMFDSLLTPPLVTRYGYEFSGWSPAVPATVPSVNTTYTAQWTPKMVTITFDANSGAGGLSAQMAYGSMFNAPIVTRAGYEFTGWSPAIPTTVPASNVTYTAQWTLKDYHLTPQPGSTTVVNSADSVIYGLKTGIKVEEFKDDFVTVIGNARVVITLTAKGFGTGTKVEVVDNETQEVIQSFVVIIFGDVNGDGNIDGVDAGIMADVENYYTPWTPDMAAIYILAGDLNGDGNLDSIDAGIMIDAENHLRDIDQANGTFI